MRNCDKSKMSGFTLVEIMIVVAIIGLLATLAIPSFLNARNESRKNCCLNNQRVIWDGMILYSMATSTALTPAEWPNLCACRNRLAPGGSEDYVRDWKVFECPVSDGQNQHDYAYVVEDGQIVDIRCNNTSSAVRDSHNEE